MRILVCVKAVPGAVSEVKVAPDGKSLQFVSQLQACNECDEYALEEALYLKKTYGGDVTALTVGGMTTQEILFLARAKGADKGVRIDAQVTDSFAAATVLVAAAKTIGFDLLLTGTQARDSLSGATGIVIAEKLGLPYAYSVTEVVQESQGTIKVKKELGGGRNAYVRMKLPAVLCIQTGIQQLNYVPPARVLRARQQPNKSMSLTELGIDPATLKGKSYSYESVFPPVRTSQVKFLEGAPPEIAAQLLAKIKEAM
jgi:electron transfer flavoprotein beta subunit